MKTLITLASIGIIGACTTAAPSEPKYITKEIKVPTPTYCTTEVPMPDYPDETGKLLQTPSPEERLKAVVAARPMRIETEAQLRSALNTCKGPPQK